MAFSMTVLGGGAGGARSSADVRFDEGNDQWHVRDVAQNGEFRVQTIPLAGKFGKYVVVGRRGDCISVDLRPAFAKGATKVMIFFPEAETNRVCGHETYFDAELHTPVGFNGILAIRGEKNRKNWWMMSLGSHLPVNPFFRPVRRHYRRAHEIPAFVKKPCQRLDVNAPGEGPILIYSHDEKPVSEAGDVLRLPTYGEPRILFEQKGEFAHCTKESPSPFTIPVKGNLNPVRGTIDFWVKREWKSPLHFTDPVRTTSERHVLFDLPADAGESGDGSMKLFWDNNYFYFQRGDIDKTELKCHRLPYRGDWRHYTVVWDDYRTLVYSNGVLMPYGHIPDGFQPLKEARKIPTPLSFVRDENGFSSLYFGNDTGGDAPFEGRFRDLRIWSEPMSPQRIQALFEESNGGPLADFNGWDMPFDSASNPIPETNRLSCSARDKAGVPGELELVRTIRFDSVGMLDDPESFRRVGSYSVRELDGVKYLSGEEDEKGVRPRLAARLRLDRKIPFYFIEIDYPDDEFRTMEVLVQFARRPEGCKQYPTTLQCGVMSGEEYPLSKKVVTSRYLYWTESEDAAVVFRPAAETLSQAIAVSAIRVYRPKTAALPEAMPCSTANWERRRHFAFYFEDMPISTLFARNFAAPGQLQEHLDRQIAYMKYCGQDLLVFPGVFYKGLVCDRYNPRRLPDHYLKEFARRFDKEGLGLVPTIHLLTLLDTKGEVTREAIQDGTIGETAVMINADGKPNPCTSHGEGPVYCFLHPDMQSYIRSCLEKILNELAEHPSFKGIGLNLLYRDSLWWGGINSGYNGYVIAAFERATGIAVPKDCDRPAWIKAHCLDRWIDWRCDALAEFYKTLDGDLKKCRKDLRLRIMAKPDIRGIAKEVPGWDRPNVISCLMREAGIDMRKLREAIPDVQFGNIERYGWWRDEIRHSNGSPEALGRIRDLLENPDYYAEMFRGRNPVVTMWDSYYESPIGAKKGSANLSGGWFEECNWRVGVMNPVGRNVLRDYALALRHGDVMEFGKGGFSVGTYGTEDVLAPWMRAFRTLPAVPFDTLQSPDQRVVVRGKLVNGVNWRYVLNISPETIRVAGEELKPYELKVWNLADKDE